MNKGSSFLLIALTALVLAACSAEPGDRGRAAQCQASIAAAERSLNNAKANNIGSSVRWGQAASLIAAAKVQENFGEYQNCVNKANSAQAHLRN